MSAFQTELREFLQLPEGGDVFNQKYRDSKTGYGPWKGVRYEREFEAVRGPLLRHHVFAKAEHNTLRGIVWALVWGYPRGKTGGENKSLKRAMEYLDLLAMTVNGLRHETLDAAVLLAALNEVREGLGTASTTKIAYFARMNTIQGPALIMDNQAVRAIIRRRDPELVGLIDNGHWGLSGQRALTNKTPEKRRIELILNEPRHYPEYLAALHAVAASMPFDISGQDIERFFFVKGREMGDRDGKAKRVASRIRQSDPAGKPASGANHG